MTDKIVVGIDGGGTTTRVLVADPSGSVLAYAESGGANPAHNGRRRAETNVREGIERALAAAGVEPDAVVALTAGFAGLDDDADREWAEAFVDVSGLACRPVVVNDAVVAHAGALETQPGIVAICGTGSIVFGMTDDGRHVRNYDFGHYARAAARHLGKRVVHALLVDGTEPGTPFVERLFAHWELDDVPELRDRLLDDPWFSTAESDNVFDSVAPIVTAQAADGDPLACDVCDAALDEVLTGIRGVCSYFDESPVDVAPLGSVLRSEYMSGRLRNALDPSDAYRVVEPTMSPVAGAVAMGIERIDGADDLTERLLAHPASSP